MLIIKTEPLSNLIKDQDRPEFYITKIFRDEFTNEVMLDFKLDIPISTLEIAKSGAKKIKIIINEIAIKRTKTDFEKYKQTRSIPASKTRATNYKQNNFRKISNTRQKNISSMDEITTGNYESSNNAMSNVHQIVKVPQETEVISNMILSHARQAVSQTDLTKTFNTKMTFSKSSIYSTKNSSNQPEEDDKIFRNVVIDFISLDDVILEYLKIKRSGASLEKTYNNKSSKIVGQTVGNSRQNNLNVKKQNTIDGAMTTRVNKKLATLHGDPNLDQIDELNHIWDKSASPTAYKVVARSALSKGIAPTDLIDMSVDDVITAKMLFAGTGIID